MAAPWFAFGEKRPEYEVPVFNERAVRASAGILFLFAIITFGYAFLRGNYQPTRVFVVGFVIDFAIRLFINPSLSPTMIVGQWFVRKQQPEYVGAPQKRFAWAIGFVLALFMSYLMVYKGRMGPTNMLVCGTCLTLMFFESAFGICIGCKLYNVFNREKAKLCPGGVCELEPPRGAGGRWYHAVVVLAFAGLMGGAVAPWVLKNDPYDPTLDFEDEEARCEVPLLAKLLGHEAKWKSSHGCL